MVKSTHHTPIAGQLVSPVAVGGIGGSGTRVVAMILRELGFLMGPDLNDSLDNLWFTLLFKRMEMLDERVSAEEFRDCWRLFVAAMSGNTDEIMGFDHRSYLQELIRSPRLQHNSDWLNQRKISLEIALDTAVPVAGPWGWKEPNTHLLLDRLLLECSNLKYIHVLRNGLDMIGSTNQNQLDLWGRLLLSPEEWDLPKEARSLRFWRRSLERVSAIIERDITQAIVISFDRLCTSPPEEIQRLCNFLKIDIDQKQIRALIRVVAPPLTLGRHRNLRLDKVSSDDIAYVRSQGFIVD